MSNKSEKARQAMLAKLVQLQNSLDELPEPGPFDPITAKEREEVILMIQRLFELADKCKP